MAQSALAKKFMKQMKKKPKPKSDSDKKFEAAIKELYEKIKVLRDYGFNLWYSIFVKSDFLAFLSTENYYATYYNLHLFYIHFITV